MINDLRSPLEAERLIWLCGWLDTDGAAPDPSAGGADGAVATEGMLLIDVEGWGNEGELVSTGADVLAAGGMLLVEGCGEAEGSELSSRCLPKIVKEVAHLVTLPYGWWRSVQLQ